MYTYFGVRCIHSLLVTLLRIQMSFCMYVRVHLCVRGGYKEPREMWGSSSGNGSTKYAACRSCFLFERNVRFPRRIFKSCTGIFTQQKHLPTSLLKDVFLFTPLIHFSAPNLHCRVTRFALRRCTSKS